MMLLPLKREPKSVTVQLGDIICDGTLRITSLKGPNIGLKVAACCVDDDGGVHFRQWNGFGWEVMDL